MSRRVFSNKENFLYDAILTHDRVVVSGSGMLIPYTDEQNEPSYTERLKSVGKMCDEIIRCAKRDNIPPDVYLGYIGSNYKAQGWSSGLLDQLFVTFPHAQGALDFLIRNFSLSPSEYVDILREIEE